MKSKRRSQKSRPDQLSVVNENAQRTSSRGADGDGTNNVSQTPKNVMGIDTTAETKGTSQRENPRLQVLRRMLAGVLRPDSLAFYAVYTSVFFLFVWWFWSIRLDDFLYLLQNGTLFCYDSFFWKEQVYQVGGFLRYVTLWLLQFGAWPWLGGFLWAGLATATSVLFAKIFRIRGMSYPLAFLPVCFWLILQPAVSYFIYEFSLPPQLFAILPGWFGTLILLYCLQKISTPFGRVLACGVLILLAYPLCGFFALAVGWLCLVVEFSRLYTFSQSNTSTQPHVSTRCQRWGIYAALLVEPVVIPLIHYGIWANRVVASDHIFTNSVVYEPTSMVMDPFTPVLLYVLIGLNVLAMFGVACGSVWYRISQSRRCLREDSDASKRFRNSEIVQNTSLRYSLPILLMLSLVGGTIRWSFWSQDFADTLAMGRAMESEAWETVLQKERTDLLCRAMIVMRNVAIFELDRNGTEFFQHSQQAVAHDPIEWYLGDSSWVRELTKSFRCKDPGDNDPALKASTARVYGDFVLFRYGHPNLSQRAAMNQLVSGGVSVWSLKSLAKVAIITGENRLADKYLRRLESTLFHRRWAKQYRAVMEELSKQNATTEDSQRTLVSDAKELDATTTASDEATARIVADFQRVKSRMLTSDALETEMIPDVSVYQQLQNHDLSHASREMRELKFVFLIMIQEMKPFIADLPAYCRDFQVTTLPAHFQEAVLFTQLLTGQKIPDSVRFSPQIMAEFELCRRFLNEYKRDRNVERMREQFDTQLPGTWWQFMSTEQTIPFY